MATLTKWENIIKEKRSKTSFRDFIRDFASWEPLSLYRQDWKICRHPPERITNQTDQKWFYLEDDFRDYDFSKSFFENFSEFFFGVSHQRMLDFWWNENSDYADAVFWAKNAYLSFVCGFGSSDIFYSMFVYVNCHNIFNSFLVTENCDEIFFSSVVAGSSQIFYSRNITSSNNCWFSTNLIGCEECIASNNLQNQKYCVANKVYGKDEYFKLKEEILSKKDKYDFFLSKMQSSEMINFASENVSGIWIIKCKDVENWYLIKNFEKARNVACGNGAPISTNFLDSIDVWVWSDDFYGVIWAWSSSKLFLSTQIGNSSNLFYCYMLDNCHHCFWCMYIQNKSYCIFNKQYEEKQWYEMVEKIFDSMEKDWTIWEFLPPDFNPFYFNDTLASLIDQSFTKEEVKKIGYLWRDEPIKVDIPEWMDTINVKDLDLINYDENILKKVIVDSSWNYYRIIKNEYDFLKKYNLPLPNIHWLDRIKLAINF